LPRGSKAGEADEALLRPYQWKWYYFKVSMALYIICGLAWCYRGSLKELYLELAHSTKV
jgi:hypothetical protein